MIYTRFCDYSLQTDRNILCLANGLVLYSFYYCLINDYCLIIDRRTQVLFFIFLLTLTSDRRGLSIFALKMTLARVRNTVWAIYKGRQKIGKSFGFLRERFKLTFFLDFSSST